MLFLALAVQFGLAGYLFYHVVMQGVWLPIFIWLIVGDIIFLIWNRGKIAEDFRFAMKEPKQWLHVQRKEWGEPFLVAAILAIVIRTFLLGPYKIPTGSMRPTFLEGDRIFVDKVSYRFHEPERGDIVVFKYPKDPKKDYVKRLVGLPGETLLIRDGKVEVNGESLSEPIFTSHYYYNRSDWPYGSEEPIVVPENSYFMLGDNSAQSSDSRNWGFVPHENIVGRTFCIWWPLKRAKLVD